MLLTRSKDLALRLKHYTKDLIRTQVGISDANLQDGEAYTWNNSEEDTTKDGEASEVLTWNDSEEDTNQDLFSLDEQDFPLVCTFSYFLRLLENTIRSVLVSRPMWNKIIY